MTEGISRQLARAHVLLTALRIIAGRQTGHDVETSDERRTTGEALCGSQLSAEVHKVRVFQQIADRSDVLRRKLASWRRS